jgi:hypothetical protein
MGVPTQKAERSPSHAATEESVVLGVVDCKSAYAKATLPRLETRRVAQAGDGELLHLDKVQAYELGQGFSPSLRGFVENFHVQPQVAGQVISQVEAAGPIKELVGRGHVLQGEGGSSRKLRLPGGISEGRQPGDVSQHSYRVEHLEGKVSFFLLQAKEASKLAQVGGGSQHLGDVSKSNSRTQGNAGNLAASAQDLGTVPGFKRQGYQVAQQKHVIVAGPEGKP